MKPKLTPAEKRKYAIQYKEADLDARLNSDFCRRNDLAALELMQKNKALHPPGRAPRVTSSAGQSPQAQPDSKES